MGRSKPSPPLFKAGKNGKGGCTYFAKLPALDDLAPILTSAARGHVNLEGPKGSPFQSGDAIAGGRSRVLVHVLNYNRSAVHDIKIKMHGKFANVSLLSPDSPRQPICMLSLSGPNMEIEIPELRTYSLLVFDDRQKELH